MMPSKLLLTVAALSLAAFATMPGDGLANDRRKAPREHITRDDCTPYNGPDGYYGNPYCDGGFKYAEDYAPGTSPYFDLLDLPQLRRLKHRWD